MARTRKNILLFISALINEEIDKANHLHLALMVDHIAEVCTMSLHLDCIGQKILLNV